jgi:lysophospholipase L1-like esterase
MHKLKLCLFLAVGLLVPAVIGLTLFYHSHANADEPSSNWMEPSPLILHREPELMTSPLSLNGNIDCVAIDNYNCVISTNYGSVNQSGGVKFKNTKKYHTLYDNVDDRPHLIPVPSSDVAITYTADASYGLYLYFNNALEPFVSKITPPGTPDFDYQLNQPPDAKLADKDGHRLATDYASISFSPNGIWMVVSVPNVAMVRVNLSTFEVLPFAQGFNYTIGADPAPQTAITNDGRYATVASRDFDRFEIYDLSTCLSAPSTIVSPVACQSRNLQPIMRQQISGYTSANNLRFIGDTVMSFYANYEDGSQHKTSKFILSAGEAFHKLDYLAVGDSFISGEGARNYQQGTDVGGNKCHLSLDSYPLLLGRDLDFNAYRSVACSGAKAEDIINTSNMYKGQANPKTEKQKRSKSDIDSILANFKPGYIDQLDFVTTYQPKVITISVGGNDIGFSDIFKKCAIPWNIDTCYNSYEDRLEQVREINSKFSDLVNTYQKIKNSSTTDTRIYVIGYPQIAKVGGDCALNVHLNSEEIEFSQQLASYLDSVIEQAASKAGVAYVDTQNALNGHRFCETDPHSVAMNGLTVGNDTPGLLHGLIPVPIGNESFHPNALGHQLLERAVLDATIGLTLPMPAPDPSAEPPTEFGLPILQAPPTGRPVNITSYDYALSDDVLLRGTTNTTSVSGTDYSLQPNTNYNVSLHSEPVNLGTYKTDSNGNLNASVQIPSNVPAGFHTLHIYGSNIADEPIDLYKTIYVAASLDDLDGNGVPNSNQPCLIFESSGQDYDQDGIDDICDGDIGSPPNLSLSGATQGSTGSAQVASKIYLASSLQNGNFGQIKTSSSDPKVESAMVSKPKTKQSSTKPKTFAKTYPDQRPVLKTGIVSVGLILPSVFAVAAWKARD